MKKSYLSPKFKTVSIVTSAMIAASAPRMRNFNNEGENIPGNNNNWNGIWSR